MRKLITFCTLAVLILAVTPAAQADLIGVALGTDAPYATIGGYAMTAFDPDPQPISTVVSSVASPLGGFVDFSPSLTHYTTPGTWATWSHGYTGDVYWTGDATSVTLAMPAETVAFYLYAEPNPRDASYWIIAYDQYGAGFGQFVDGDGGAKGFGFYADPGSGQIITSIQVDYDGPLGFAVGEFGIAAVPVPGAILLGILGLSVAGVKLRKFA